MSSVSNCLAKGAGFAGQRLLIGGNLARHRAGRNLVVRNREQRLAVAAIKQVDPSLFGGLRDRVNHLAVVFHGHERRGRGKVAIPHVVFHGLEMPDPFTGLGIQSKHAICEEIVSQAIGAIEIACSRTGRGVHNSALLVHRHARPIIRRAAVGPGILRPSV